MFQRAIAATVAAAFLAVIGMGCNGPEAQPVLKNTNTRTAEEGAAEEQTHDR